MANRLPQRCKRLLMILVLGAMPAFAGNVGAAGFQPWSPPGIAPPPPARWRFDQGECRHALIGGAVGGLLGGAIGSRIGRRSGDGPSRLAATAFGSFVGYVIGSQIGRSMDESDAACARPPRSIAKPPTAPGDGGAIGI